MLATPQSRWVALFSAIALPLGFALALRSGWPVALLFLAIGLYLALSSVRDIDCMISGKCYEESWSKAVLIVLVLILFIVLVSHALLSARRPFDNGIGFTQLFPRDE